MSMQIAQKIPFRPTQCSKCLNYAAETNRCRAFAVESWPSPLLAVFDGESEDVCTRFFPFKAADEEVTHEEVLARELMEAGGELPSEPEAAADIELSQEPEPAAVTEAPIPPVEETPVAVEPSQQPAAVEPAQKPIEAVQAVKVEAPTPPPARGEARIHCRKCRAENPKGADRCQRCNARLLPGESAGTRISTFIMMWIIAAGLGYLVYHWYIQSPESAPNIPALDAFLNPIVLGLAALIAFISGFVILVRRTPEYLKYQIRATRHEKLNPWQALEDLDRAVDEAPDKEKGKLIKQRAKLYEHLGFAEDAARDYLLLITSPNRFKGEADAVSLFIGADSGVYEKSRRDSEIKTVLSSGKARAVGYCPQCDLVVELNPDERCFVHPKVKGREVEYVIPADIAAGKLAVMQKMETAKPKVSEQISKLLVEGKATAIGYCPKCTGVVELDPERLCRVHPKARIQNIQYAVPRDLAAARKRIFTARQGNRLSSTRAVLYVVGLLLLAYAVIILLDIDLGSIFQR